MEHKISKQSIRTGVSIYQSGEKLDKDKIISMSEKWSDKDITFFKKCLSKEAVLVSMELSFILQYLNKSITKKVRLRV